MSISNLALSGLAAMMNRYLRLDAQTLARLTHLQNKVIKIEVTDFDCSVYVGIESYGLALSTHSAQAADSTIAGTSWGLLRSVKSHEAHQLRKNGIQIRGDLALAEQLQAVLSQMDIDWEQQISQYTGDVVAHYATKTWEKAKRVKADSVATLERNVMEYLHQEAVHTPSRAETELFYQQVATLRDDVERAQARIRQLSQFIHSMPDETSL